MMLPQSALMFSPEQCCVRAGDCLLLIITLLLLSGKRGAELHMGLQATACPVCFGPASQSYLFFPLSSRGVRDEKKISLASAWELHAHLLQQGSPVEGEVGLPSSCWVSVLEAESCFSFLCLAGLQETHSLHGLFALQVEPQACTYPCQCPSQPLQCPAGTSHVLDACGCCKVCARQLGELCSLQKPCDHHKGLYCDFSKIHRGSGICLGESCMFCYCAVFLWPLQTSQKTHGIVRISCGAWSFIQHHVVRSAPALRANSFTDTDTHANLLPPAVKDVSEGTSGGLGFSFVPVTLLGDVL